MIPVAIVEDHKTTRLAFERIINLSSDCRCACACGSAEDGLRVIPEYKPDVVLMDIKLPKMSGVDCVARLKEILPGAQVIMVTVYEDPDTIFRALRAGASGYVLKRAPAETILDSIREVKRGGVPMSVEIARKVIAYFQGEAAATKEAEKLTSREREVLDLVAQGFSNKEIADRLKVTVDGVLFHLKRVYQKLHVHSRTQAIRKLRPGG